jgi:hypothetical protein
MAYIHELYVVERTARDLSAAERASLRQTRSRPILDSFRAWLDAAAQKVLPKSPIGGAIG